MKTMGKAITQLGEGADFDNNLFEEQSHAQLGIVSAQYVGDKHSFATKALSMQNLLLLDSQSSVHIMCNPDVVRNIRRSLHPMVLKSNEGKLNIPEVADFEGFETETWFLRDAMTNILSFLLVKSEYDITYDGDAFIIHWAAKGFPDPTRAGCMCMTQKTPEDWQVTSSWRQWRVPWLCLPSARFIV
jgi:hypothetical protein